MAYHMADVIVTVNQVTAFDDDYDEVTAFGV
jgi:hypothetical protein